jgi:hypothetical protein
MRKTSTRSSLVALALVLLTTLSWAQAALVQSAANATGSNSIAVTISASGTAHLLAVLIVSADSTNTVSSVADDVGNIYHQAAGARSSFTGGDNAFSDIWYAENSIPGATTVTVICSSGASFTLAEVFEVSGIVTSSSLDGSGVNASNAAASGTSGTGPSFTASTTDFILTGGDLSGYTAISSPWTMDADGDGGYILNGAAGTFQPVFTLTSGIPFSASLAGFKVAGAVVAPKNLSALGVGE